MSDLTLYLSIPLSEILGGLNTDGLYQRFVSRAFFEGYLHDLGYNQHVPTDYDLCRSGAKIKFSDVTRGLISVTLEKHNDDLSQNAANALSDLIMTFSPEKITNNCDQEMLYSSTPPYIVQSQNGGDLL